MTPPIEPVLIPLTEPPPRSSAAMTVMNEGGSDVAAYVLALVCILFAALWAFLGYKSGHHTDFDDGLVMGCLLAAVVLAAPANAQRAIGIIKPLWPFGKHE